MSRIKYHYLLALILLHSIATSAHELKSPTVLNTPIQLASSLPNITKDFAGESQYERLKTMYALGLHDKAISEATTYLQSHPQDVDVRLLLGIFYFHTKDYQAAKKELGRVLEQTPNYTDASLILLRIEMLNGHYQRALSIATEGLIFAPENLELHEARAKVQTAINSVSPPSLLGYEDQVVFQNVSKSQLTTPKKTYPHPVAQPKNNKIVTADHKEKEYLNEIGIIQQNYYISDVSRTWDYSTLYYGRATPLGKVFGKINYANRLGYQAIQGEIEAFPKLNKYVYLDIDYAFANEPNLFPDRSYVIEAYVTTKKAFDFSIGAKYNVVDKNHQFYVYTGSITKFLNDYKNSVTFRPYFFVPVTGQNSTLYTLNIRHVVADPYFYFGCLIGAGNSPDLADLTTVNFLVTRNKIINPYINFPLHNDRINVKLSFLYQNQLFNSLNKVRDWTGGTMSLAWSF